MIIDASSFSPQPLLQDSITIVVSKPYAGELSNYSISFVPSIPIENDSGCFVKFVLPDEIELKNMNINETSASNLLEPFVYAHNID